jgi:pteridine reductase
MTKVALVTGAARRIGSCIANTLHQHGFNLILHYRGSASDARQLAEQLNQKRPHSACCLQADLNKLAEVRELAKAALKVWGSIDVLINNASSFYPTAIATATEEQWDELFNSNVKGPYFLTQALLPALQEQQGCVINIVDIHADRPLAGHSIYCMAKASVAMMTKTMARELAPTIRVNGIAPGAILWPEAAAELSTQQQQHILERVPLGQAGQPDDIAKTVLFLVDNAPYITGQIIAVDGGRSLHG